MNMVNPLSHVQLKLPHMSTFKYLESIRVYYMYSMFITKVVLSSSNPCSTSDCTVMAIYGFERKLAFAKPGDDTWNTVETTNGAPCQYFPNELLPCYEKQYLVESEGCLLVVSREGQQRDSDGLVSQEFTESFDILRLNAVDGSWTELDSLGNRALFLGDNSSFSIAAIDIPGIKPDHIYYTDDYLKSFLGTSEGGGRDTDIFGILGSGWKMKVTSENSLGPNGKPRRQRKRMQESLPNVVTSVAKYSLKKVSKANEKDFLRKVSWSTMRNVIDISHVRATSAPTNLEFVKTSNIINISINIHVTKSPDRFEMPELESPPSTMVRSEFRDDDELTKEAGNQTYEGALTMARIGLKI
ncbi:hypothetical protein COLO4_15574 [Corchorus olitorius]|uniref:KIB1-4 beta-propeller domain-containing protein n=1 Tax=Corchorus olitorius TaxID=93759 RepID=A0A1R3JML6_9ROSI|nr:hypothetical protein COLO4_15574 [Corchorus olitorius]